MATKSYTLLELNEYLKRVLALNVRDAVWVKCEITQANITRGHFYLELVEKRGEEIVAKSKAIIWAREAVKLNKKLKGILSQLLQPGIQVMLQVKVNFHEVFGLKFIVTDIDPAFTLGELELKKRAVVSKLKEQGLLRKNSMLPFPLVPQRLAVLSSERAAGWHDFLAHLQNNPYDYVFDITLFSASVQGELAVKELVKQLSQIESQKDEFDIVVIIRGGGARLDLVAFDDEHLCTGIANSSLPVLTGIGHEVDETIADLVAFRALKTPTAVAGFLIDMMIRFESELNRIVQLLQIAAQGRLKTEQQRLENLDRNLKLAAKQLVKQQSMTLSALEKSLHLLDPKTILNKGYSLTTKDNKIITKSQDLKSGEELTTILKDGEVKSIVK
ncbi:MAG: exodeoxyribonuclease VII large subunit [Bacteroidota bacterium]